MVLAGIIIDDAADPAGLFGAACDLPQQKPPRLAGADEHDALTAVVPAAVVIAQEQVKAVQTPLPHKEDALIHEGDKVDAPGKMELHRQGDHCRHGVGGGDAYQHVRYVMNTDGAPDIVVHLADIENAQRCKDVERQEVQPVFRKMVGNGLDGEVKAQQQSKSTCKYSEKSVYHHQGYHL